MPRHSRIVALTSALPYEGTKLVRKTYHEGSDAARIGDANTCLEKASAINNFANRHRIQVAGAFVMAAANAVVAYAGHDTNWISAAYDMVYGAANVGVVHTQRTLARQLIEKAPEEHSDIEAGTNAQTLDLLTSVSGSQAEQQTTDKPDLSQKLFTNGAHAAFLATTVHSYISLL